MAFLELHDIHKSYYLGSEEFPVLKGISLNFERGEFVSILGESGGGKSTLMNIIGGLDRQFTGSVIIDGHKLDHHQESQMDNYRRGTIGYIYQAYNLISHLTVLDNVLIALDMTDLSREERRQRALDLLKQVGLSDQVEKYPRQLSGGQKQRVAIARALASDPQVIIADEPTGALDSQNTQEVLNLLTKIAQDGKLVIAVTHSQEVANHGTRIVHLVDGKIDGDRQLRPAYPLTDKKEKIHARVLPLAASLSNAFKHFKYHKGRNSLIVIGTAIGLFAVLLFSGLGNGINNYIQNQINSLANPRVISVIHNPSGKEMNTDQLQNSLQNMATNPQASFITESQVQRLKKVKHVTVVEKGYSVPTFRLQYKNKTQSGASMGTWTKVQNKSVIKHGHQPGNGEILLTKRQATQLAGRHYQRLLNKQVPLTLNWINNSGAPVQIQTNVKVSGIADGTTANTMMSYHTLYQLFKDNHAATNPVMVSVKVDELSNVNAVASKINNIRDRNGRRVLGAMTVGSILKRVNSYVNLASTVLSAIAAISLLVSALMIIVSMYMSVAERTKEIGILRAIGERKKDIRRLFTSESIFIGLFAAVLATVLAELVALILNHYLYSMVKFNIVQITPGDIGVAFIAALVISLLAALLPARRAANLNPIDALAGE